MIDRVLNFLGDKKLDRKIRRNALTITDSLFHHGVPVIYTAENIIRYLECSADLETYTTKSKGDLRVSIYTSSSINKILDRGGQLLENDLLRANIEGLVSDFERARKMDMGEEISDAGIAEQLRDSLDYVAVDFDAIKREITFFKGSKVLRKTKYQDFNLFEAKVKSNIQSNLVLYRSSEPEYETAMDSLKKMFSQDNELFYKLIRSLGSEEGRQGWFSGIDGIYQKDFDRLYPGLVDGRHQALDEFRAIVTSLIKSEAENYAMLINKNVPMSDKAPGGIDFNAKHMRLDITVEHKDTEMNFNPSMLAEFKRGDFSGVVANIVRITTIKNPFLLFGINSLQ